MNQIPNTQQSLQQCPRTNQQFSQYGIIQQFTSHTLHQPQSIQGIQPNQPLHQQQVYVMKRIPLHQQHVNVMNQPLQQLHQQHVNVMNQPLQQLQQHVDVMNQPLQQQQVNQPLQQRQVNQPNQPLHQQQVYESNAYHYINNK